ncbi:MAG: sigma 54-interacting transcriptional regulator [Deltaproteobacteria bacterium]|nr:sigma 54-interacting transcriptional regulator [Deltaproteobacteria bacterium]
MNRSFTHEDIIGKHPRMREIISSLPDIAESESAVLIEGPTGSGKELIARAIHSLSPRKGGPFIAVNCAALPDTLLESELFGYAKGAFTGAVRERAGRFLLANRGTLFLDEISNTSAAFQADLLRVLEEGEFIPLGGTRTVKADFRVIAASNMELKRLVQAENFRQDLYYRLNVVRINLPRLRERREDIPLLIDHFIRKFNLIKGKVIEGVAPEVLSLLMDHAFPGNIRELENIVEYAFVYCKCEIIGMEHLPEDLLEQMDDNRSLPPDYPLSLHNEEAQNTYAMLCQYKWNRQEAARALGISRSTLWRKMKKYGLMKQQNEK